MDGEGWTDLSQAGWEQGDGLRLPFYRPLGPESVLLPCIVPAAHLSDDERIR